MKTMLPFVCVLAGAAAGPVPTARAVEWASSWSEQPDRAWIGADYFANRLQDWRLSAGRLECLDARPRFPFRTVHVLTRFAGAQPGALTMSVRTQPLAPEAWAGFLIGAGGADVDYRISAMVHAKPARDGGLLAVVDGGGMVALRDFSQGGGGGSWAVAGVVDPAEVPIIESASAGSGFGDGAPRPVELRLAVTPTNESYTVHLAAHDARDGRLLSETTAKGVPAGQIDGSLALVSHLGAGGRGHWFEAWRVGGTKVVADDDRAFGPVLSALHTLSGGVLKMTAQMGPLGEGDARTAALEVQDESGGAWRPVATAAYEPDSATFTFRVEGWDAKRAVPYRVAYDGTAYGGTIRAEPNDAETFVLGALTCNKIFTGGLQWNSSAIWFPHAETVAGVRHHDPDMLYFSGDQIYEGDLTPSDQRDGHAIHDYLYKWYRWCWSFRDLCRDIPTVCVPDDHDVYHGNIWGAGGRPAVKRGDMSAQDAGGYKMPPRFVNVVHRTQTAHLPDPVDPAPVSQGISVYFTRLEYAGMSFAILADRMWKSPPAVMVPEGEVKNGWFQAEGFDPRTGADVGGAMLLGPRQLAFLRTWAADWSDGAWMKVVLSQTPFANVATIPAEAKSGSVIPSLPILEPGAYPDGFKLAADTDSNGWPQSGRNVALREMRRAFAFHIVGDQHLASTIQYGVEAWRDAGFAFATPAIANTWPRRWYPPEPGANRPEGAPPWTGDFRDGFGNLMTVFAVANPTRTGQEPARLHDRTPGYGIVRFDRASRDITIECWPRWVDPAAPDARQYAGWPIEINQLDNYGRDRAAWLPTLEFPVDKDVVVQVIDELTGGVLYTLQPPGPAFQPWTFREGTYTVVVSDGSAGRDGSDARPQRFSGLRATPEGNPKWLRVRLPH